MVIDGKRLSILVSILLIGCESLYLSEPGEVEGYVPVYGSREMADIKLLPAQPVTKPGKIYIYGNYLLINEIQSGIHVFDNSDKSNPEPLAFVQLLGNTDMAIKDHVLYADCLGELVAIRVENFDDIEQVGTLPLSKWVLGLPPPTNGYFECIDESKGVIIGWRKETLTNPKCRYYGADL